MVEASGTVEKLAAWVLGVRAEELPDAAVTQATNAQQSVSGVNLDEEAANLLRYQQAYQACGKVMQIAGQLFDTLMSINT